MCKTIHNIAATASDFTDTTTISSPLLPNELVSSKICQSAFALAKTHLSLAILHHSLRVFYFAWQLTKCDNPESLLGADSVADFRDNSKYSLLFTACILHDLGTCQEYDGEQRFEVEGADAALTLLQYHGISGKEAYDVWVAIALHTSPHIGERIGALANLVRRAVLLDFGRTLPKLGEENDSLQFKEAAEKEWPRLNIEKVLCDAVVEQAVRQPAKAPPASWPGILYRAHLAEPEWDGVNKAF